MHFNSQKENQTNETRYFTFIVTRQTFSFSFNFKTKCASLYELVVFDVCFNGNGQSGLWELIL